MPRKSVVALTTASTVGASVCVVVRSSSTTAIDTLECFDSVNVKLIFLQSEGKSYQKKKWNHALNSD